MMFICSLSGYFHFDNLKFYRVCFMKHGIKCEHYLCSMKQLNYETYLDDFFTGVW